MPRRLSGGGTGPGMPKDVLGQLGSLTLEEKRAVEEAERVRQRAATHAMDGPSRRPRARGY